MRSTRPARRTHWSRPTTPSAAFATTSNPFAITIGPAAKLAFVTSPNDSTGGIAFTRQPRVAIQDAGGNTVTGNHDVVSLDITRTSDPAAAALVCNSGNTRNPSIGIANFAGCKVNLASVTTYTLAATVTTGLTLATSAPFDVNVGPIARLAFSQQPSPTSANGEAFAQQPEVSVEDAGGNVVTTGSSSVTLSITQPSIPESPVISCTNASPLPTVNGVAVFTGCAIDLPSSYTLQADIPGFTRASTAITIT